MREADHPNIVRLHEVPASRARPMRSERGRFSPAASLTRSRAARPRFRGCRYFDRRAISMVMHLAAAATCSSSFSRAARSASARGAAAALAALGRRYLHERGIATATSSRTGCSRPAPT